MTHTARPAAQPDHPLKVFKHLLVFAVARLTALGDHAAVEQILEELPPVERKGQG